MMRQEDTPTRLAVRGVCTTMAASLPGAEYQESSDYWTNQK